MKPPLCLVGQYPLAETSEQSGPPQHVYSSPEKQNGSKHLSTPEPELSPTNKSSLGKPKEIPVQTVNSRPSFPSYTSNSHILILYQSAVGYPSALGLDLFCLFFIRLFLVRSSEFCNLVYAELKKSTNPPTFSPLCSGPSSSQRATTRLHSISGKPSVPEASVHLRSLISGETENYEHKTDVTDS